MHLPSGWELTPWRAAVHAPTATAVIADLHLGYLLARQASGDAVPAHLPGAMESRVAGLVRAYGLQRLIIAGDLVERGKSGAAAVAEFLRLRAREGVEVHHVRGNHDRGLQVPSWLICHGDEWTWAGARIVHFAEDATTHLTFMGHLHPVLRDARRRGQAPCYVQLDGRVILPAQSDDAAGANVLGQRFPHGTLIAAIVGEQVLPLGPAVELRRRLAATRRKVNSAASST